jgi:type III restriction enzyme
MRLKNYQTGVLDALSDYLKLLSEGATKAEKASSAIAALPEDIRASVPAPQDATVASWNEARKNKVAASPDPWRELKDGTGRSIPHICLKLPTGGGKTLLAAHSVDRIMVSHFHQAVGFILWIVPSEAIYAQTKTQLADRSHPIRQALDRASAGRVKILEKLDGFTRQDLVEKLCVMLLMLQSTGRENKETLKVFQDSGQYTSFFPQDDPEARKQLIKQVPNLEQLDLAEAALGGEVATWIKQSLGNTLRVIRPLIVLDEGHRAYSDIARRTLASLNPRFILELSATPDREQSNILVNVSGRALKEEEMIKLPIRLDVDRKLSWQKTLQRALDRLDELEKKARAFEAQSGRYIRPIMLVRVDRTGKDQREKGGDLVHAEDAFEYLTQKAGVPPNAIRRQTAELKELKDDDLLSPYCDVRVIITKDALREGWDCPFAYVLAILSRGTANTALTQMIGRVLRQPHAQRTKVSEDDDPALDETHIFCTIDEVKDAVANIKKGLEAEGMGDLSGDIVIGGDSKSEMEEVTVRVRKAFQGKRIMVPRVLHRDGKKKFRDLDYEADVLGCIDFEALSYRKATEFNVKEYDVGKQQTFTIDLKAGETFDLASEKTGAEIIIDQTLDRPGLIRRMIDVVPNPWQGARILDEALATLRAKESELSIINARLTLVEHINRDVQEQVEAAAEAIFREKVKSGDIVFKLLAAPLDQLNFEFVEQFKTHAALGDAGAPLLNFGGAPLDRALYDRVFKRDVNGFEADVALYMDGNDAVKWWWRIAARRDWGLQGWMKNRVYPDFLIRLDAKGGTARLMVLETKGKHLEGSADTEFKAKFFALLESAYTSGHEAGDIELFADAPEMMRFKILIQEPAWKNDLENALLAS